MVYALLDKCFEFMMFGVIAVMVFDRKSYFLIFMIAIKENMIEAYFATDYSIDTTLVQEYTIKEEKIVRYLAPPKVLIH